MARNEAVTLTGSIWTELSDAETIAAEVAFQNIGGGDVTILATTGTSAPAATVWDGFIYSPGEADARTLAVMFPGLTTPIRLWARGRNSGKVMVSYA